MKNCNKRCFGRGFLVILALFVTMACSDGSDKASRYDGSIRGAISDKDGRGVDGARMVLMERTSNAKFKATADNNGFYYFDVPKGIYDLSIDKDGFVTLYTGPLTVLGDESLDLALSSSDGIPSSSLTGRIFDINQDPLSGTTVTLNLSKTSVEEGNKTSVITDSEGFFELEVSGTQALDLDFFPPEGTQEFVDIVKLDKPCYVDFHLGSDAPNIYRHDEAPDDFFEKRLTSESSVAKLSNSKDSGSPFRVRTHIAWAGRSSAFPFVFFQSIMFSGGRLGLDQDLIYYLHGQRTARIALISDGNFWYDYAIIYRCNDWYREFYENGKSDLLTEYRKERPRASSLPSWNNAERALEEAWNLNHLNFVDATGDVYETETCGSGMKKISFDSDDPTIVSVFNYWAGRRWDL